MKRIASIMTFAALSIATLVPSTAVFADRPGQLSNGTSNYEVKNVTKNGSYSQSASVACNETVKYSVLLANSDYGLLKNVTVKADLASGNISASATNTANATTTVAGKVAVTVTGGGTLTYLSGTTVRTTSDGKTSTNLPDGLVSGGVNAGDLNGSTQTFVQFQAKLTCETPPVKISVCELATKKIITIDEKNFDAAKHSKDLEKCKEVPPVKIQVCELSTKKIITIDEKDFVTSKHSKNLNDCKVVVPGKIQVCEISTKTLITINENEFDAAKHTKNLNDCAKVLATEAPTVLPSTGPESMLVQILGASSLTGAITAYVRSRKLLG